MRVAHKFGNGIILIGVKLAMAFIILLLWHRHMKNSYDYLVNKTTDTFWL